MQITRIPAQRVQQKTRVAVYCRVSTKLENQEDSLEMQKQAYLSLIGLRSDWELVEVYADSLSGLSAEKRPQFMRMIRDAQAGKIDRILCKSISRFSRNVAECKKYTDMLRMKNVTVEFEKEHLRTDEDVNTFISDSKHKMEYLSEARNKVRNKLRRASEPEQIEQLKAERDRLTAEIGKLRKDIKTAEFTLERSQQVQKDIEIELNACGIIRSRNHRDRDGR